MYVLGGTRLLTLSPHVRNEYLRLTEATDSSGRVSAHVFYCLSFNGETFYSAQYGRVKSRNSYTVMYHNESEESALGQIQFYILLPNKTRALAVVKELVQSITDTAQLHFGLNSSTLDHTFKVVEPSTTVNLIDVTSIKHKCLYMDLISGCKYAIHVPSCVILQD